VEEAIVILKANKNAKQLEYVDKTVSSGYSESVNKKDYVIKEAESVISNYISKVENNKKKINNNTVIERKYKVIKIYSAFVSAILIFAIVRNFFA
jgi:hypothetical protein